MSRRRIGPRSPILTWRSSGVKWEHSCPNFPKGWTAMGRKDLTNNDFSRCLVGPAGLEPATNAVMSGAF